MFRTLDAARGNLEEQGLGEVIDQAALQQTRSAEGIICFVIHKNDLAARDFTRAQTVYQQS